MTDVGDTLSLLAAGIAFFVLLAASFSRRSTWIALGSIAMSMALLSGSLFLATIRDRGQVKANLEWVATELPILLDRQTAHDLWASIQQIEAPWACGSSCSKETAIGPRPAGGHSVQAPTATTGWLETKPVGPVAWNLDEGDVQLPVTSPWGFSISGTNVSGSVLERVEAILKPDSDKREVPLVLSIEGATVSEAKTIPTGARFDLFSSAGESAPGQTDGAILTFRYMQAGQSKSSIFYLSPAILRSATR